jgi:hypothetical protein
MKRWILGQVLGKHAFTAVWPASDDHFAELLGDPGLSRSRCRWGVVPSSVRSVIRVSGSY